MLWKATVIRLGWHSVTGKTLVGFDSGDTDLAIQTEQTGGAKTHTIHYRSEMPAHTHDRYRF